MPKRRIIRISILLSCYSAVLFPAVCFCQTLPQETLDTIYAEASQDMAAGRFVEALHKFKKTLDRDGNNEYAVRMLNLARERQEALTKKTVTSKTPDPKKSGLRIYTPGKCFNGYTLFAHRNLKIESVANTLLPIYLVDMHGSIVHEWMVEEDTISASLKPDGTLAYINGEALCEVDPESNTITRFEGMIDHTFQALSGGYYLISRNESGNPNTGTPELPRIEIIKPPEKISWRWEGEAHIQELERVAVTTIIPQGWWANNNACEVLNDSPAAKGNSSFRKGNILFSFSALNIIGVLDYPNGNVLWAWPCAEVIVEGHHATTMLPSGNILIFDNGIHRGWSRVVELNPITECMEWEYHAEPKESFFSKTMSSAQRLPNGNTLICEAEKNRIFEITPEGEIVWDFISDFNTKTGCDLIYRATRYSPGYVQPLLEKLKKSKERRWQKK
ncbi:MAG: arylsulfotransferase family protein [Candidatus Omnitrophica bacterium]|nr:arylsulfotransferase family protein [Candidatus Omnitrophota bacterium]